MAPPRPRKSPSLTLEGVVTQCLKDHRGRLLMDCRWYCVCGWTSPREGVAGNHAVIGEDAGRAHQAAHIALALAEQAKREQEEEKTA